jgi:hypothetical protein
MRTSTIRCGPEFDHSRSTTARKLRVAGTLLAVLAAAMWFVMMTAPGASATPSPRAISDAAVSDTGGTSCPTGSTCATIPADCPVGTTCPEVILSPTTDVGSNQWVFISAENFPPNDPIYVYYCSDRFTLAQQDPVCMLQATPEVPNPQVVLTASPTGTSSISFATEEDTDDGNEPLDGKIPGTQTVGSFFCDDFVNPCSIDVTDPRLGGTYNFVLNPSNAVAVPITFAKPSTGCPTATFVNTASEFGIDRVFPIAAEFDCVGKSPAIGINTDFNSVQAVTSMVGGAAQLAFIDEPNAPDVQAELAQLNVRGKPGYALIPVALSAQVIGFKATMESYADRIFPQNTFSLTPTMVAGLVTNYYSDESLADMYTCGKHLKCSLLAALDTISGFRPPAEYGGYVRSDTSDSTGELFNWLCSAPIVPVEIGGQNIVETDSAAKVLVEGLQAGGSTVTSCPDTDQFPPLTGTFAWASLSTPSQQALKLAAFVPPPNDTSAPVAGFAPMNWSWANYYGLLPAALQNAAGDFVLPSAESLDAAVDSATSNPNGTLSPSFATTTPNAYPLPDIWYAVVPTTPQPAVDAVAYRTLLDDVLNVTGGSQSADLPAGFVPLPTSIYTAALAEVNSDIHEVPPTPTTTTTTSAATTTNTVVPPTTAPATSGLTTPTTSGNAATTGPAGAAPTTTPTVTPSTAPKIPTTTRAFQTTAFTVFGHSYAWMAPTFVSAVALALLLGPGILLKTRRRVGGTI